MALKSFNPLTPVLRTKTVSDFAEITADKPFKALTVGKKRTGGRNAQGVITSRRRGGGAKKLYRLVDFRRDRLDVPCVVETIEYDPNRTARIALVKYVDGQRRYILAPVGLTVGADDYVTKPFSPREIVARVKAILRRTAAPQHSPAPPSVIAVGNVEVDLGRREARVDRTPVALATREFDLLAYLAANQGLALSRRQLLDGVWGDGWIGDDRTVDVHVRQLRKKLGDGFPLDTVWGVGYRLG